MSGHSQTPPGSVGPVPIEGISGAMLSRHLHTPRHLQGVWDQFTWKESPEQCLPEPCTLLDAPGQTLAYSLEYSSGTKFLNRHRLAHEFWKNLQHRPMSAGP